MASPVAQVIASPTLDPQVLAQALGGGKQAAQPEAAPSSSRYVLTGVVADRSSGGAALIAVDGKAAKAVRVGGVVEGDLVLQSVTGRRANLGARVDGPATVTLEMTALAK